MADTIWRMKTRLALGARKASGQSSIDFLIRADASPDAFPQDDINENFVALLRPILLTTTHIVQITHTPTTAATGEVVRNRQLTARINQNGSRAIPNGAIAAPDNMCASFFKSALQGNPGETKIRGCYTDVDLKGTDSGEWGMAPGFNAAPFAAFAEQLEPLFTAQGMELVMKAPDGLSPTQYARPVIETFWEGVTLRQVENHRVSIDGEKKKLALREAKKVASDYKKAQKNNGGNPLVGEALHVFEVIVADIIVRFGLAFLLTLPLPPQFKLLAGIAGALTG